jgi:S1-C subfamily serine protease
MGKNSLWVRHPDADVAVMKITLPDFVFRQTKNIPSLSTDQLADDGMMERFEIHPGDQLLCLGYPFGLEANVSGFPILRSGKIASYPLTPAKETKTFLFDFEVFQGNSGGPVYFVDKGRSYGGKIHGAETIQFVAGIVTEQKYAVQLVKSQKVIFEKLNLAVVVPSYFIKETLALLDKK